MTSILLLLSRGIRRHVDLAIGPTLRKIRDCGSGKRVISWRIRQSLSHGVPKDVSCQLLGSFRRSEHMIVEAPLPKPSQATAPPILMSCLPFDSPHEANRIALPLRRDQDVNVIRHDTIRNQQNTHLACLSFNGFYNISCQRSSQEISPLERAPDQVNCARLAIVEVLKPQRSTFPEAAVFWTSFVYHGLLYHRV